MPPTIETSTDGTQTLHYDGHVLDLPVGFSWALDHSSGEYFVTTPGKTPKSVKGLMKLKRVRKTLGWWGSGNLGWGGWVEVCWLVWVGRWVTDFHTFPFNPWCFWEILIDFERLKPSQALPKPSQTLSKSLSNSLKTSQTQAKSSILAGLGWIHGGHLQKDSKKLQKDSKKTPNFQETHSITTDFPGSSEWFGSPGFSFLQQWLHQPSCRQRLSPKPSSQRHRQWSLLGWKLIILILIMNRGGFVNQKSSGGPSTQPV